MSRPPAEPLVVILGSTGTGKSDLAVELACRFQGEVINADAMQMYRGLPITTNKISKEEQRGVPHHLLGTIGLEEESWKVGRFRQEATRIIHEIRSRGRLPIVVGGTHYYTDGLLFDNHLVDDPILSEKKGREQGGDINNEISLAVLDGATEDMYAMLKEVDPVMAGRWHPKDRRKIRRSLEIFLTTGRRASDIYALQKQEKNTNQAKWEGQPDATGPSVSPSSTEHTPFRCLLLWVYARRDALNERLDSRIDTMLSRGLMEESMEMHNVLAAYQARGMAIDRSKGIWQSIGHKELEPYLEALKGSKSSAPSREDDTHKSELDRIRTASLESMKVATRRYARYQLRWIKHKTIALLAEERALDHLFLLDSTDKAKWQDNVAELGARLTAVYLGRGCWAGEEGTGEDGVPTLPAPTAVSDTAREVITATVEASQSGKRNRNFSRTCDVCCMTLMSEDHWDKHVKGQRHRRVLLKRKRRALVPVPLEPQDDSDRMP